ncbi:MAG: manganese efflux pump MntP family protein [Treponemataceae bacterium]|nr:manganese efflux pump MntP family protein [Treponemataceae bacterium]
MGFIETFLIGVGLSMDAFAVAICKGLKMRKLNLKQALIIGLFFGGFQALMPLIGYLLGTSFSDLVSSFDHWIAFILLAFIGGKMAIESFKKDDDADTAENQLDPPLDYKELFIMAVATSIDALAVGISFAFLNMNIIPAITIIGITTFCLSIVGVWVGNKFGEKYKSKAELAGGIILVGIGIKILVEHLLND